MSLHDDWFGAEPAYSTEPNRPQQGAAPLAPSSRFSPVTIVDPAGHQPARNLALRSFAEAEFFNLPATKSDKRIVGLRLHQLDGATFDFAITRESAAALGRWLAAEAE